MKPKRSSKLPMRVVRSWSRAPSRPSTVHVRFSVPPAVSNVTIGRPSSCSSKRWGDAPLFRPTCHTQVTVSPSPAGGSPSHSTAQVASTARHSSDTAKPGLPQR